MENWKKTSADVNSLRGREKSALGLIIEDVARDIYDGNVGY